jgi:hypothetical protein
VALNAVCFHRIVRYTPQACALARRAIDVQRSIEVRDRSPVCCASYDGLDWAE